MKNTIMNGAIAVHHTATTDEPWDGPGAVAAMPNDPATLHYCHAWQAPGAGDKKADYKFPHHKTKGGPANLAACRNGLARLSSASIPDSDATGVKAHLEAHINDGKGSKGDAMRKHVKNLRMARPVQNLTSGKTDWFRIENKDTANPSIYIYDEIGFFAVSAQDFTAELNKITAENVDLHINSPGGEVFDGMAIMQALKEHPAHITAYVDGIAASAASFICMGADEVVMAPTATMMIHDGFTVVIGNAADLRKEADLLDKISGQIASTYADKTGIDVDTWRQAMMDETWYTAEEAVAVGLADRIAGKKDKSKVTTSVDVGNEWNLSIYNNLPTKNDAADGNGTYEPKPYKADPDETVICPNCDKHNNVDAKYCDQCGTKLAGNPDVKFSGDTHIHNADDAQQCKECKAYNKADATKCKQCGAPIGDNAPSTDEEENDENPTTKRVPTSAKLETIDYDPEFFRSAIAAIGWK